MVVVLLALFVGTQYPDAWWVPFINDDYIFLEKTRAASFGSLWSLENLTFNWYRPWSRELHYWALQHLFGAREAPFHVVSLLLWLGVMAAYHALARRVATPMTAAVAVAGLAAMSAWAVPVLWVAAVQELWALLFCLLSLLALARGRPWLSAAAFALALLSKETAAVLPGIAFVYGIAIERRSVLAALRRILPHAALALIWAAFHPMVGGRLRHSGVASAEVTRLHDSLASIVSRTLAAVVNLDALPSPDTGWKFLLRGLVGAVLLVVAGWAIATIGRTRVQDRAPVEPSRAGAAMAFGIGWALIGWLPVAMPTIGWHAYYTLLGAMGAWLVLASLLAPRPRLALAMIVATALLRTAQGETPSRDWGAEWYQRRAGSFLRFMRADLLRKRPELQPHSRLFFTQVPSNVGFLTTGGPAVRVWYGDTTLSGAFWSDYHPRLAAAAPGPDLFFRYDSTAGWVEVAKGEEDLPRTRAANPKWEQDHRELAAALVRAQDWRAAAAEFEKLATAAPDHPDYAMNVALCYETVRDFDQGGRWYERVLSLPSVNEADRKFAREFKLRVRVQR